MNEAVISVISDGHEAAGKPLCVALFASEPDRAASKPLVARWVYPAHNEFVGLDEQQTGIDALCFEAIKRGYTSVKVYDWLDKNRRSESTFDFSRMIVGAPALIKRGESPSSHKHRDGSWGNCESFVVALYADELSADAGEPIDSEILIPEFSPKQIEQFEQGGEDADEHCSMCEGEVSEKDIDAAIESLCLRAKEEGYTTVDSDGDIRQL